MKTCTIIGCTKKLMAKGMCNGHYYRLKKYGRPETLKELGKLDCQQPCSIGGCGKLAKSGYRIDGSGLLCGTHYMKLKRSGTLEKKVFGPEWRQRQGEAHRTPLSYLDPTPDRRKGHTGYLAVNVVNDIRAKAKQRGLSWEIDPIQTYKLITSDCAYCGQRANWPASRNGIDRVDNSRGYAQDNCVSCCATCNSAKGTKSQSEFYEWIDRVSAVRQRGLDRAGTPTLQAENLVKEERAAYG